MSNITQNPNAGKQQPQPAAASGEDPGFDGPNAEQTGTRALAAASIATFTLVHVPVDSDTRLCKAYTPQGTADIEDLPYLCTFEEVHINGVPSLRGMLDHLSDDPRTCILRARPLQAGPCRRILRDDVKRGDDATLEDVPRAWVMIDFDSVDCPEGIDFAREPHKAAEHMRRLLPSEFRDTACVWRASSNAGLKPGIRLHCWFLLSAPLNTTQLERWLRDIECDAAALRPNQPHFTADPIFEGVADPMSKRRGVLQGRQRVQVPAEIVNYTPPARSRTAPTTTEDPLKAAALRAWEAANPFEEPSSSSERLECPACTSRDGIAVREDGRWNCHGGKHVDNAPAIGTYTGNVYVGHRIEFQLKLTARDVIPYLKRAGFWPKLELSGKFYNKKSSEVMEPNTSTEGPSTAHLSESNETKTPDAAAVAVDAMSAIVTGEAKPSIREYERASSTLRKASKVIIDSGPGRLAELAEECARFVPMFLDEVHVKRQLRDAAVRSPIALAITMEEADAILTPAIARGKNRPHRTRAQQQSDGGQLPLDERGQPARSIASVYYYCSQHHIRSAIALDDRAHRVVVIARPPWWVDDDREFPRELEDSDYPRVAAYIADRFGFAHAGVSDLHNALQSVAQDRRWDPVEDYLDGLQWEGTDEEARELLGSIPAALLGVKESNAYTCAVFLRWCIAAVQRTYEPGCMFREVMTLVGPQNIGKSQFLRALCADPAWFSDTVNADGAKDSRSDLDGKWIVEFAELDKHMKDDRTGAFKNYISNQVDAYRRSYGRLAHDFRRRNVFAATTNVRDGLFVDPTGNTRFNPLHVTEADVEGVRDFRDKIWAAAKHLYEAGEKGWLQLEERKIAVREQAALYNESSAEKFVRELLESSHSVHAGNLEVPSCGFRYDAEQLHEVEVLVFDTDGNAVLDAAGKQRTQPQQRFKFLAHTQVARHLQKQGCTEASGRKAIHSALRKHGWVPGRVSRVGHPTWGNREAWGDPRFITSKSDAAGGK